MDWFHLTTTGHFGYPQPEDGYLDHTYEFDGGCRTCGMGKKQKAPFRFRSEPKAKHSQFLSLNWIFDEIFVRKQVVMVFQEEQVTGVEFSRPVKHRSGDPLESTYQMQVCTVLPPAVDTTKLTTQRCEMPTDPAMVKFLRANKSDLSRGPFCGRQKHNFPQGDSLRIVRSALDRQPDVVRINEWFGSGGSAWRPILVSDRVKRIIEQQNWRGAILAHVDCF